ncbi:MAG TPA: hypothetical protein VFW40_05100 [Capsulimonadaceae bacterium]|nr:hypothetical protein [Capsulimonadaceae bacterium]
MKIVIALVGVLLLVGVVWALAFFQVIPAQRMADKSPGLASVLIALHVAKHKPKANPKPVVAKAAPAPDPLASEKAALDAQKQQLDQEKAALDKKLAQTAGGQAGGSASEPPPGDTSPKLISIYTTMKSDDIARIFAKLPDSAVVDALNQLDDRQAGKILAALPDARAAKITALMNHMKAPQPGPSSTATAPGQSPQQVASSGAPSAP